MIQQTILYLQTKDLKIKTKVRATKAATTQFNLILLQRNFEALGPIVAMSKRTNFHSTEIMMVHDGTSVDITQYGTL